MGQNKVSAFQRLKCTARVVLGMQEWYLGWEKVSRLEVSSVQGYDCISVLVSLARLVHKTVCVCLSHSCVDLKKWLP